MSRNLLVALVVVGSCYYGAETLADDGPSAMRVETLKITFVGVASGGVLTFVLPPHRNADYFSIVTETGEPAESVVKRLAKVINETDPFGWHGDLFIPGQGSITADGGSLGGLPGLCILAGTETGLGIPAPPRSLSCTFDRRDPENRSDDEFALHWVNPPEGYDSIRIQFDGFRVRSPAGGGTATSYIMTRDEVPGSRLDMDVCVIGYRGDLPSNAATITLKNYAQEELVNIPFTAGVAPNWAPWTAGGQVSAIKFEQGEKWTVDRAFSFRARDRSKRRWVDKPEDKRFYQLIKASRGEGTGGVWRQFLGLIPEHRYRISVRMNTLAMNAHDGAWSFSFHAAHNGTDGRELTPKQMAGMAPLPDGTSGPEAGQIAAYGTGGTTNGNWEERTTSHARSDRKIGHITLPPGVDTITIWARHSGANTSGVGFDWAKVEDLDVR